MNLALRAIAEREAELAAQRAEVERRYQQLLERNRNRALLYANNLLKPDETITAQDLTVEPGPDPIWFGLTIDGLSFRIAVTTSDTAIYYNHPNGQKTRFHGLAGLGAIIQQP